MTSALPVLTARVLSIGTLIAMSSLLSPPRKPERSFGAITLICLPCWLTIASSACRPETSTVVSVVSSAVMVTEPLPFSTYRSTGSGVSNW